MNRTNNFKEASETAVKMLKDCGFEAFLIGGSVRDYIMKLPIGDIDITTSATLPSLHSRPRSGRFCIPDFAP